MKTEVGVGQPRWTGQDNKNGCPCYPVQVYALPGARIERLAVVLFPSLTNDSTETPIKAKASVARFVRIA
jgi:hypothetical protein